MRFSKSEGHEQRCRTASWWQSAGLPQKAGFQPPARPSAESPSDSTSPAHDESHSFYSLSRLLLDALRSAIWQGCRSVRYSAFSAKVLPTARVRRARDKDPPDRQSPRVRVSALWSWNIELEPWKIGAEVRSAKMSASVLLSGFVWSARQA